MNTQISRFTRALYPSFNHQLIKNAPLLQNSCQWILKFEKQKNCRDLISDKRYLSTSKSPWEEANGMLQGLEEMKLVADFRRRGNMTEALPLLQRALEITAALGQQTNIYHLTVRRRLAEALHDLGDYKKAVIEYQHVIEGLDKLEMSVHSVPVYCAKVKSHLFQGDPLGAIETSQKAVEVSENQVGSETDTDLISQSYKHLGAALLFGEKEDEAIDHFQMSSRLATSISGQAHGLALMGSGCVQKSDDDKKALSEANEVWDEALELLRENIEGEENEAERNAASAMEAWIMGHQAELKLKDKKYDESNEVLSRALKLQEKVMENDNLQILRTLALLGEAHHRLGNGVTSEGLLISAMDSFEVQNAVVQKTPLYLFLKSQAFQSYSSLLLDWDKREESGKRYAKQSENILNSLNFSLPSIAISYPMIHLF
mmetsp:Transcript_27719/g.35839  ORF Transcript_27719/g.35839 Transcript_27719/m.35839 type:complete len:430 (-) Transcript_27719:33-1322(-)